MRPGNFLGAAVISAFLLAVVAVATVNSNSEPELASVTTKVVR